MKKNILSVIGAATVAAVALKLTTKYVKNEVIKELEDDGYLYDDDDCDDCDECCGCDERMETISFVTVSLWKLNQWKMKARVFCTMFSFTMFSRE